MTPAPRLLLAIASAAVALAVAIGVRAERWFGLGDTVVRAEVTVATDAAIDPAAVIAAWRRRLPEAQVRVRRSADDRSWTVEVRGEDVDPTAVLGALDRPGALALHWVVSNSDLAKTWYRALGDSGRADGGRADGGRADGGRADGVWAEVDAWGDHRGETVYDYYLRGPSAEAIVAAVNALGAEAAIPDDLDLVFEWVDASIDRPGASGFVRTYLIERAPLLTGADVVTTAAVVDDVTGRPVILVTFTDDGAARLALATRQRAGQKLAILVDDWVSSAPVVQGPITGGRTTILPSGPTHAEQLAHARETTAALTGRAQLPRGLTARLVSVEVPGHAPWLARGGLALLVAALVALASGRIFGSTIVGAPVVAGARGGRRSVGALVGAVAVTTAVVIALWWLGGEVLLAGVSSRILDVGVEPRTVGVFNLGLRPYLAGVFVIELAALAIPTWRRRRLGGPAERRGLDQSILVATIVLAAIQAHFVWQYLDSARDGGPPFVMPGLLGQLAVVASGVAGVLVTLVAARIITRWGLGHGVVVLVGVEAAHLAWSMTPRGLDDPRLGFAAAAFGLMLAVAVITTRRVSRGPRLPLDGLVPAALATYVVGLIAAIAGLVGALDTMVRLTERSAAVDLAVAAAVVAVLAWWRRGLPTRARDVSAALVAAIAVAPWYLPGQGVLSALLSLVGLGVIALELALGAWVRLRLVDPVAVVVTHGVDTADGACDRLADAGVPHAAINLHLRAALRWLAAYAPISVVVAGEDRARAEAALAAPPR